jgi:hypothetical protein
MKSSDIRWNYLFHTERSTKLETWGEELSLLGGPTTSSWSSLGVGLLLPSGLPSVSSPIEQIVVD